MSKNIGNDKYVNVIGVNNNVVSTCTPKRAYKIVARGNARWIDNTSIKLKRAISYKKKVKQLVINDDNSCYICGRSEENMTIDHVIPKALGGGDDIKNLKTCCSKCNKEKANKTLDDFFIFIINNREDFSYIKDEFLIKLATLLKGGKDEENSIPS